MLSRTLNSPRLPMLLLAAGLTAAPWTSSMAAGMEGMDHGSHAMHMDASDSESPPSTQTAPAQSRTPIPPITDEDRAAVYTSHAGHQVHDSAINSYFLADKLEWQDANDGSALAWDLSGWIGGDIDRLLLRSEGERTNGKTEEAEIQALWGHSISPWWDVVAGARQDFKPGAPQTWAAFGLQGQAISDLDIEATAFIGEAGQTAARLEADYDLQLTSNVVLQPTAELNFYGKNDPQRGNGSGLSTSEFGLRLRYEITPQFAPYVGVSWDRSYGKTADYAREDDEDTQDARLVVGVRMWF
ncbi:copper resistance protein B [Pseudomonas syringae]|uniref:copper resistance protein B n=1 Tax=Pseudomonas syringae TaxID=317 RepID=UPI000B03F7EB|nr:copper resistance protein B [Pseudomonas syringae]MBI6570669.1 copper resistance protein B [Pseudomonas syringae]MBI6588068.1 copper resistance protein B [Pseudomonas syringae]MBI6593262.1 copper resistance protein B [Pseudomonas syringae]MDC6492363.1 copper resistance protein B [Pseudomonas syringae]